MNSQNYWSFRVVSVVLWSLSFLVAAQEPTLEDTINALAIDPRTPSPYFYAATGQGLFISRDEAVNWLATDLVDQAINDIAINPEDPTMLLAAAGNAGVLKSANGGKSWDTANPVRQHSPDNRTTVNASLTDRNIQSVTFVPSEPGAALAGSFGGVIYKTGNEGTYWTAVNPDNPLTALNTLAVHPAEANTVYAGTGGNGVLKSTDGGSSWRAMNIGLTDTTVTRLVIDPVNPDVLYAGTYGGGVFRSGNGGASWEVINSGLSSLFIYSLAILPRIPATGANGGFISSIRRLVSRPAPSVLYTGVYGGGLFKSIDGGESWQSLDDQ